MNSIAEESKEDIKQVKINIIFDLLMSAQCSIVANSSKVRVLRIPRESLDYISEPIRRQVRAKILNLFIPMPKDKDKGCDNISKPKPAKKKEEEEKKEEAKDDHKDATDS